MQIYIYIYISKGLQCALTAITIVALWQLPHLGHGMCVYTLFGLRIYIYIYIYIQRITMCPHGYHHSGSMATPALGDTGCAFTHCLDCIVKSPECSNCEQWAMHSANSERPSKGALHPIQESAQTAQAVSEISKGLQCALTAITIAALWQLPHLGHGMCVCIYIYIINIYIYIYIYIPFPIYTDVKMFHLIKTLL